MFAVIYITILKMYDHSNAMNETLAGGPESTLVLVIAVNCFRCNGWETRKEFCGLQENGRLWWLYEIA